MALTASAVKVGVTGSVYVGSTATAAPTSSVSALAVGFAELGYVSPDGIEESIDTSTSQIRAWQNGDLIREVITESTATFKFTLMETTKAVVELYYGTTVSGATTSAKVDVNPSATGGKKSFVFNVVDGASVIRTYVASGEVTAIEPVKVANGEVVGYGITVTAYPSSTGVAFTKWSSDFAA
jgi:hypothetical protein